MECIEAAAIAKEKSDELCRLIPGLKNELNLERGKTKTGKDNIELIFKNGSKLDIMAARQSSRGRRYTGGLIEECILVDQTILNEVIIPTMNVDRRLADGNRVPQETVNKSQVYVTTAGYKNTFAYEKLIELLIRQVIYPDEAVVMGGSWRIPVMEKLLQKTFVAELKAAGTYNDASFAREYESIWSGDQENAFFSAERFDYYRQLTAPETEYSIGRGSVKGSYYVLAVDVGRLKCTTECVVIKVVPQQNGASLKEIVNIYTWEAEHFEEQCINLKKLYYKYRAHKMVVDGNGMGIGLVDYLVKSQTDEKTGEYFPSFGVDNDDDNEYKKYKKPDTEIDAVYIIKAHAGENTEAYSYVQTQVAGGKVRFLIDEVQAKGSLLATKEGQQMSPEERANYLYPFTQTSILKEQMMNLVESTQGINIILKQVSRNINKDKFSAFAYGMYYIKKSEDSKRRRKKRDLSKLMLFSKN